MKLVQIIPHLYLRGGLAGLSRDKLVPELLDRSINVVVSLVDPKIPELEDLARGRWFKYYYAPIPDGKIERVQLQVHHAANYIVGQIRYWDSNVLVHCYAGKNRAGLVSTLVVAEMNGISYAEALEHVRALRPGALNNKSFERYLLENGHVTER